MITTIKGKLLRVLTLVLEGCRSYYGIGYQYGFLMTVILSDSFVTRTLFYRFINLFHLVL